MGKPAKCSDIKQNTDWEDSLKKAQEQNDQRYSGADRQFLNQ